MLNYYFPDQQSISGRDKWTNEKKYYFTIDNDDVSIENKEEREYQEANDSRWFEILIVIKKKKENEKISKLERGTIKTREVEVISSN